MTYFSDKLDGELGELVRIHRLSAGLSQVELGEAAGISYQQIQKYESGANKVSVSRLFAVAHALGMAPSELLSKLERRIDGQDGAEPMESIETLRFLSTRRGQQVVRAMALCEDQRMLDAFVDLLLAATGARCNGTEAPQKQFGLTQ